MKKHSPKYARKICLFLLVASIGAFTSGCDQVDLMTKAPGTYAGIVIKKTPSHSQHLLITGTVSASSAKDLTMRVNSSEDPKVAWDFKLHIESAKKVTLTTTSDLFAGEQELKKDKNLKFCYTSLRPANSPKTRLCYDGTEISISYTRESGNEFIFALDRHVISAQPVMETPKSYSVSEILQMAKNRSFTSRIQFQKSVQSSLNSSTARANLLPKVSLGTVMGLVTFQWNALVNLIGDLVPFLIPSNWVNAQTAKWQSNADYNAWLLMKANSANIAEGLAYITLRDRAALKSLRTYEGPLKEMRAIVHEKEVLGLLARGSTNTLKAILSSLKETETQLIQTIAEENRSLSQAVGFINPDAISDITEDDDDAQTLSHAAEFSNPASNPDGILEIRKSDEDSSMENPSTLTIARYWSQDPEKIRFLTLIRSLEIRQVDSLINVARSNLRGREFSWLNPSGSLGFSLPSTIYAGRAAVTEVELERMQIQNGLLQKVANAADKVTSVFRNYSIAKENAATLKDRFDQLHQGMMSGLAVSLSDIQLAIQDQMKGDLDLINAKYTYFIAAGNLNRILMVGPYLDIITRASANFDPTIP